MPSEVAARSEEVSEGVHVGSILHRTFRLWAGNLAFFSGLSLLLFSPLVAFTWKRVAAFHEELGLQEGIEEFAKWFTVTTLGGPVLFLFASAFVSHGVVRCLRGDRAGFLAALVAGLRRLPGLLWVGFLVVGALFLWMIPGSVVARMIGSPGDEEAVSLERGIMAFVVLLALLVPPIMSIVRLSVAMPVSAIEGRGGLAALARSRDLTRGNRWRVFGVFLVLVLLHFGVVFALGRFVTDFRVLIWMDLGFSVLVSGSLMAVACGVVYEDLRAARDGTSPEDLARVFE